MYQNKLLCYKVCYCLGVAEETLETDFTTLHGVAKVSNYFDPLKITRTYRAISHIYFHVLRNLEHYRDHTSRPLFCGSQYDPYVKGTMFNPLEVWESCDSVRVFLRKLAERAHILLPSVYEELKPGLDYLSFEMLCRIDAMRDSEIERVSFLIRRLPRSHNIYFFSNELFNISLRDANIYNNNLLKADAKLKKAVAVVTGAPLETVTDTSALAATIKRFADGYFVHADGFKDGFEAVYFVEEGMDAANIEKTTTALKGADVKYKVVKTFADLNEKVRANKAAAIIAHMPMAELEKVITEDGARIVLTLPLPKTLYRKVLSGAYGERVSLLSLN